jgi:hypothetical protein
MFIEALTGILLRGAMLVTLVIIAIPAGARKAQFRTSRQPISAGS